MKKDMQALRICKDMLVYVLWALKKDVHSVVVG